MDMKVSDSYHDLLLTAWNTWLASRRWTLHSKLKLKIKYVDTNFRMHRDTYRWSNMFPQSVTIIQKPVNISGGKHILWKKSMIQELVHERADIYFNFICKYLKSCSLEESELCLMLTLTCELTSLHSLGPSYSPWPCPDIMGPRLTLVPLAGNDPESCLWAHVQAHPWAIPISRYIHDDGAGRDSSAIWLPRSWLEWWSESWLPDSALTDPWGDPSTPSSQPHGAISLSCILTMSAEDRRIL